MSMDSRDVWEERLNNWALWLLHANGPSTVSAIWDIVIAGGGYDHGGAFVLTGEAMDTHALVLQLDTKYRQAIHARYVSTGSDQENANDLQITVATLNQRVLSAKDKLDELQQQQRHKRAQQNKATRATDFA